MRIEQSCIGSKSNKDIIYFTPHAADVKPVININPLKPDRIEQSRGKEGVFKRLLSFLRRV